MLCYSFLSAVMVVIFVVTRFFIHKNKIISIFSGTRTRYFVSVDTSFVSSQFNLNRGITAKWLIFFTFFLLSKHCYWLCVRMLLYVHIIVCSFRFNSWKKCLLVSRNRFKNHVFDFVAAKLWVENDWFLLFRYIFCHFDRFFFVTLKLFAAECLNISIVTENATNSSWWYCKHTR